MLLPDVPPPPPLATLAALITGSNPTHVNISPAHPVRAHPRAALHYQDKGRARTRDGDQEVVETGASLQGERSPNVAMCPFPCLLLQLFPDYPHTITQTLHIS